MKLIISDSTTVITLLNIDRLDVLTNIFSLVYLPQKVYDEVVIEEQIVLDESFFVVKKIEDKKLYKLLLKSLDAGECEAIVLAKEMELSLIIDEKKGRKIASNLGINIFGFIGLLILNYKNGLLSREDTVDVFYRAKEQGFRVGMRLEREFLGLVGSTL
jgi:predicted nucleic acid-binding protein